MGQLLIRRKKHRRGCRRDDTRKSIVAAPLTPFATAFTCRASCKDVAENRYASPVKCNAGSGRFHTRRGSRALLLSARYLVTFSPLAHKQNRVPFEAHPH